MALSATQSKPERQPADPLTSHTCVHEARAYLANTGQDSAVVTRNGRPVGVITSEALSSLCPSNLPITAAMDYVTVHVNPESDTEGTLRAFTAAAWQCLKYYR